MKKQIIEKIKEYEIITIFGHIRPDGDCLGSQIGLKNIILTNFSDKQVYVVGSNSDYLSFLGKTDEVQDNIIENSLAIVVDTAIKDRISDQRYQLAKEIIKIDHHLLVDSFGVIELVDTKRPACAEIITSFLLEMPELKINLAGAHALYVGLITDTSRFRYRGVSSNTMNAAGYLLDNGVDVEYIDSNLSRESMNTIQLKSYVYANFKSTPNGALYITIKPEIVEKYQVSYEEAANMVNLLGGIIGYPIWALIIEYPTDIRIRIRSSGPQVDLLANKYGGGGHLKAAGAKLENWDELDIFLKDLDDLISLVDKDARL